MAHNSSYTYLYADSAGLGFEEVAVALGEPTTDIEIEDLCLSENINKWAKHKPVDVPKVEALTESERIGTDTATGHYYGVKMASQDGNLLDLLNVTFEYDARPTGYFRLLDFDGYDHNAVCTISGAITGQYTNVPKNIRIAITIDKTMTNTTGIDYGAIIDMMMGGTGTPSSALNRLKTMYPCILIRNNSSKRTFVKALFTDQNGLNNISKLYDAVNGLWVNGWYLDITGCPAFSQSQQTYTLCVFLTSDVQVAWDIASGWKEITGMFADSPRVYGLPNACPKVMTLQPVASVYTPSIVSINTTTTAAGVFTLGYAVSPNPSAVSPAEVIITLLVKRNGRYVQLDQSSVTLTTRPNGLKSYNIYDLILTAESGDSYDIRIELRSGSNTATGDYTIVVA